MLTSWNHKVLYIGVTGGIEKRIYEHKTKQFDGFSKKYNLNKLVYIEKYNDVTDAITREKQLKGWTRKKKNSLVEKENPTWSDLSIDA